VIILAAAWLLTKEKGISGGALIASTLTFSVSFLLINQFRDLTDYPFSVVGRKEIAFGLFRSFRTTLI
jgi:hypothetical protein